MTPDNNLRYRVVGVGWNINCPQPQTGLSCHHEWTGTAYSRCPKCGDVAVETNGQYHWLDRATSQPLTYKDGGEARFDSLDEAISAFVEARLSAERNEVLA